jgi:hypothetical protein
VTAPFSFFTPRPAPGPYRQAPALLPDLSTSAPRPSDIERALVSGQLDPEARAQMAAQVQAENAQTAHNAPRSLLGGALQNITIPLSLLSIPTSPLGARSVLPVREATNKAVGADPNAPGADLMEILGGFAPVGPELLAARGVTGAVTAAPNRAGLLAKALGLPDPLAAVRPDVGPLKGMLERIAAPEVLPEAMNAVQRELSDAKGYATRVLSDPEASPELVQTAMARLEDAHLQHELAGGGFTYDPRTRQLVPKEGFAVANPPGAAKVKPVPAGTPGAIRAAMTQNADALRQPRMMFGGWPHGGQDYLEVSEVLPDRGQALAAARARGEKAIYDLAAGREIPVDYPTETPADPTSWVDRLGQTLYDPGRVGMGLGGARTDKPIRAAAVRGPDGRIFEGITHQFARDAAAEAGVKIRASDNAAAGFVTRDGRFVTREQALQLSIVEGQSSQMPSEKDLYAEDILDPEAKALSRERAIEGPSPERLAKSRGLLDRLGQMLYDPGRVGMGLGGAGPRGPAKPDLPSLDERTLAEHLSALPLSEAKALERFMGPDPVAPYPLFHGSHVPGIDQFKPTGELGVHLGTADQANERLRMLAGIPETVGPPSPDAGIDQWMDWIARGQPLPRPATRKGKPTIYPLWFNGQKHAVPEIPDLSDWGNLPTLLSELEANGIAHGEQLMPLLRKAARKAGLRTPRGADFAEVISDFVLAGAELPGRTEPVRKELRKLGVDGLRYENTAEGAGTSFVALDPAHQLKSVFNAGSYAPKSGSLMDRIRAAVDELGATLYDPGRMGMGLGGAGRRRAPMKLNSTRTLPLSDLLTSSRSMREAQADIAAGRGSRTKGPVRVWRTEDGRLLVTDGQHRLAEAAARGDRTISVKLTGEGYSDYWATPRKGEEWTPPAVAEPKTDRPFRAAGVVAVNKKGERRIFEGAIHPQAAYKATRAGFRVDPDAEALGHNGFVLQDGTYVSRADAPKHLKKGEVPKAERLKMGEEPADPLSDFQLDSIPSGGAQTALKLGDNLFDISPEALREVPTFGTHAPMAQPPGPGTEKTATNVANLRRRGQSPAYRRAADAGLGLGGLEWYNTQQLFDRFTGELGPEQGERAFRRFMDMIAATSPGSNVSTNIKLGSNFFSMAEQGALTPELLREGRLELAPGYKHRFQSTHNAKAARILEEGGLNPVADPKTARFGAALSGNYANVPVDLHISRGLGLTNTAGKPIETPESWQYGAIEDLLRKEADRVGVTPAQYQAAAWVGLADKTGVGGSSRRQSVPPFLAILEERLGLTAKRRGTTKEKALRALIRGEAPLE